MKHSLRVIALFLAALTLLTACTAPKDPLADTTDSSETTAASATESATDPVEVPTRETYEDLSHNVPEIQGADGKSSTVVAKGELNAPDVVLEFDGESGLFVVSSNTVEIHDTETCKTCGFTGNGDYAILCHGDSNTSGGFMVTLATSIRLATVTGMTATFRLAGSAATSTSSAIRIMTSSSTTMSAFQNECPPLGEVSEEYRTIDVNLTAADKLTDSEGNLAAFQFYFRNKEGLDMYLQTVTICVNPEKLLVVEELEGNYFSRGDVTAAIAAAIAERFEIANVGAEITVEVDQYRQNNTKMDGSIRYNATAKLNDGTEITGQGKVVIPHVSGVWLDATSGSFGATHDNLGQWQETFDPSGMVLLTANTITAKEGIASAEYAVITESGHYADESVVWHTPHVLQMGKNSIEALFVNAWLDFADELTEGQRYRLLVRGVTEHDNYILHLDIPFTYSPLDQTIVENLNAALKTLNEAKFICPADTADKSAYIAEQLKSLLKDPTLDVSVHMLGEGVNSATVQVTVLSTAPATAERLPVYQLNGKDLSSVYAYEGEAMTSGILNFHYNVYEGSIQLETPFDGDTNVVLASPYIYTLFNSTLAEIESGKYPFKFGENCLPVPAELTWSDAEGGSKTYTVTISKKQDLSDPIVLSATEGRVEVYNLEIGRTYYWQVSDGSTTSQLFTFTTAIYPRFFATESISNFRDIGGYYTADGKRVKQNMVFRSAFLNDGTQEAKDFMVNTLGIKTELDLRGSGAATFASNVVNRKVIAMKWYSNIVSDANYETTRETISAFAYPENYPINFHCAVGRDRTGTTSFLLLGLLGVDEETILKEHYSSFFSETGACDREEFLLHIANIRDLVTNLSRYAPASATLQEKIEAYLLRIGVSAEEIASIREILLED